MSKRAFFSIISILIVIIITLFYANLERDNMITRFETQNEEELLQDLPKVFLTQLDEKTKVSRDNILAKSNTSIFHFWATWCGPCEAEFPELEALANKMKDLKNVHLYIIAVNDSVEKVKIFLRRFDFPENNVTFLMDKSGETMGHFGSVKLPETYVFQGEKMVKRFQGAQDWAKDYYFKMFSVMDKVTQ